MPVPSIETLRAALRELRDAAAVPDAPIVEDALEAIEEPARPGLGGPRDVPDLAPGDVAALIDHTQLRPEATEADVLRACEEAREHAFASVCIAPCHVPRAAQALDDSGVAVCTVIGFPHGANRTSTKVHEARLAIGDGAREIDMVLNVGALRSSRFADVEADVQAVVEAARGSSDDVVVKVILETALLTDGEKAVACAAVRRAGADFVKTSTGFASGGATTDDVALMRQVVGPDLGVKASGGVGSGEDVRSMVAHGATRIGASGSVGIMEGTDTGTGY